MLLTAGFSYKTSAAKDNLNAGSAGHACSFHYA
ncbi:hypothetical protein FOXG_22442 [Fusarium oxysporum f. sp. lycopersici 4287]|uniref:Uncharacterized protein n=1 Tax=Fusarium oxysporum f. sp. lycopersici (strain 4287 / CBS 123668 / FGSC 9935 / NRRL 34936) TaxID=426428 RepID=A0A0J9W764_FUSO4|nr:hypothetical protein FOXG_19265 [Fusarium oxysporum f. sp. lycopersici 4287]XP_018242804.1 hypothetical protein FOXG_19393 [Fusarium oxysporum f. sp. lycopersici 4287]XP_018244728.1 hypothetical protein FOXG_19755 [Fusarium oxysporum f. sp. lycopersici 4287]XP_018257029.1 uncharacterized protein FOXG_22442 [Fusarium oxysporum f. sp. lycopersici 4287]KNB04328.1 hypothetical protein FOXG_19265 [Fusarium oxysporum f. sp. lycopersici 4287]KNB04759.1 hypothetical protein FOXG_19393 [Fusarium oxy